ncbi:MAG: PaaI family thioesterase [Desulfomonilaceae bacterium]|nr:PaaI family thioesterase [Desulfomonilaceae bacterium]
MTDRKAKTLKHAAEVVGGDPFATFLGIKVDEVRESYARLSLAIRPEYRNSEQIAHGGALFTLADQAFAVAVSSRGLRAVAAELKINYFQGVQPGGIVTAEATPIDVRKRISLWNIEVRSEDGAKVALAQGLAYHFV